MFTGIRRRMIAYYLVVIAVIVILMGAFFIWFLNNYYMQTLRENLYNQVRLSAALVEEMLARDAAPAELDQLCKNLGDELGLRLTLVAPDGSVLADSAEDPALMEDHSTRPEIIEAMEKKKGVATRYSFTLDEEMYYLAVPISSGPDTNSEGESNAVMRVALPLVGIKQAQSNLVLFIIGALFISSLVALTAAVFLSQRITGPIEKISVAARAIAGGNFTPPVEVKGRDELAQLASSIREMGSSLARKMNQVVWEKNKLETVVSSMSSGIILTDKEQNIELINPAAENLFDLESEKAIGSSFQKAIRYYTLNENLKAVCREGEAKTFEINLYYPRAAALDVYILPVFGAEGVIIGALLIFHETTELRSLEKMRSDFVANVSHELRTPLTTVRGYTETILHENLTREELADFLKIIDKETGRLSALLDDLLDLAQIENEKGFVKKEPVDLKAVIDEVVLRVDDLRIQQQVIITKNIPLEDILVAGNSEWLRQVLINVLENSIRHGRKGGKVEVSLVEKSGTAEVIVTDDGPGIPDDDLPYVFERFYRVDKSRSRKFGSTGLGLSIVKHIMEAHEAAYSLQSIEDRGTIFSFTLPLI